MGASMSKGFVDDPVPELSKLTKGDFEREMGPGSFQGPVRAAQHLGDVCASLWMVFREAIIVEKAVPRPTKDGSASVAAKVNECTYCDEGHGMMAIGTVGKARERAFSDLLKHTPDFDDKDFQMDPLAAEVFKWVYHCKKKDSDVLKFPPFTARQAPELVTIVLLMQVKTRFADVVVRQPSPCPKFLPKKLMIMLIRHLSAKIAGLSPGVNLHRLPEPSVPLPAKYDFVKIAPNVRGALHRFIIALQAAGEQYVPDSVREFVTAEVALWNGEERGPTRKWCVDAMEASWNCRQEAENKSLTLWAKFALLAALNPNQIDDKLYKNFRMQAGETALEATVAWCGYMVMDRMADWLTDWEELRPEAAVAAVDATAPAQAQAVDALAPAQAQAVALPAPAAMVDPVAM